MGFFTDFVNNLKRNFTDPVGLAQDMGAAEEASGIKESERRFKRAEFDIGTGDNKIEAGDFYTKPMDISKTEGEQRRDDRDAAKAAQVTTAAASAPAAAATTTAAAATPVETAQSVMTQLADTTKSTSSATVEEAKKDKKRGLKGGTIATSAQGLLSSDMTGLRPKRSLLAGA
tara:strand:- start:27 stop:545 length:519 start_codon:yes stop_codon:yes gene_type:complete